MLIAFLTLDVINVTSFEKSWYFHIVIFSFPPSKFIQSKVQLIRILVIRYYILIRFNKIQQMQVFIYCKITLHVSGVYRTRHQEYIKL